MLVFVGSLTGLCLAVDSVSVRYGKKTNAGDPFGKKNLLILSPSKEGIDAKHSRSVQQCQFYARAIFLESLRASDEIILICITAE